MTLMVFANKSFDQAPVDAVVTDAQYVWLTDSTGKETRALVSTFESGISDPLKADRDANGNLILPTTSGTGVVLGDTVTSDFGWKDLIGAIQPKTSGGAANTPALTTFRGGSVRNFIFTTGDLIDFVFHMPHDWVPGTDLFIHVHWGHNGTAISGSFVFDFYTTFARGFQQATLSDFIAEVNSTVTSAVNITNTPQYRHRTDEIQLSAVGGGAGLLDTDDLEVDGLLLIAGVMTTKPTITGGATSPFIFTIDIHYQSHGAGTTANKAPSFYA